MIRNDWAFHHRNRMCYRNDVLELGVFLSGLVMKKQGRFVLWKIRIKRFWRCLIKRSLEIPSGVFTRLMSQWTRRWRATLILIGAWIEPTARIKFRGLTVIGKVRCKRMYYWWIFRVARRYRNESGKVVVKRCHQPQRIWNRDNLILSRGLHSFLIMSSKQWLAALAL